MIKDAIEDAASLDRTGSNIDLYLDGWRCLEERKGGVMADLKPCPFCGCVVNWCDCGADCPQITCPRCGQFDLVQIGETMKEAKNEAMETWNKREKVEE